MNKFQTTISHGCWTLMLNANSIRVIMIIIIAMHNKEKDNNCLSSVLLLRYKKKIQIYTLNHCKWVGKLQVVFSLQGSEPTQQEQNIENERLLLANLKGFKFVTCWLHADFSSFNRQQNHYSHCCFVCLLEKNTLFVPKTQ